MELTVEPANRASRAADASRRPGPERGPWTYRYVTYHIPSDGSLERVVGRWRAHPDGLAAARDEFSAWLGWVLGDGERFHLASFSEGEPADEECVGSDSGEHCGCASGDGEGCCRCDEGPGW